MKYSEFYKLIEQHGWTIKGGTRHYKIIEQISSLVTVGVAGYGKVIRLVRCHTSGRKQ